MYVNVPECPACKERMEEGYVLDNADSGQLKRTTWHDGQPQKGLLGGFKVKGTRSIPTITYRCPRCGWLVWFAPAADA